MPTYDYLCSACGHHFEEFQSMSAKELRKCPACKKNKLDRLIGSGAGVIFKGSGFYTTDYRGGSYSSDAKKDSEGGGSSTSDKSDKSSDKSTGSGAPTSGTDGAPTGSALPNKPPKQPADKPPSKPTPTKKKD